MSSREWEIDREIDALIALLVHGKATEDDMEKLHQLQRERVRLMTPHRLQRT